MSTRITQGIMYSRALNDVQRGLSRLSQLQQAVASGRRIQKPSDDPAAALRILPMRADLRDLEQLGQNGSLARETLNTSTASLEDASTLMARVRELTTQAANGTLSDSDRASVGAEVEQLLSQLVGIGNSRDGDRYVFGGTKTSEAPFRMVETAGGTRIEYSGNRETLSIDVAPGVTTQLNMPGDAIFQQRNRGATHFTPANGTSATGALPGGPGDTGIGFARLDVSFAGLHTDAPGTVSAGTGATNALGALGFAFTTSPATLSIGGGPALPIPVANGDFTTADGRTISLNVSGVPAVLNGTFHSAARLSTDGGVTGAIVTDFTDANQPVVNSIDGTVLYVDGRTITRTGREDVKFDGTFDAFTTLVSLRDLLRNNSGLPNQVVRDRIAGMLPEVTNAHDAVLDGLRELGFRSSGLDVLKNRVDSLRLARTESLSNIEDTDIAESILALQQQDTSYQAALQVTARLVQTSLQNYLR
jgi:flagellar hook-associated protein 3 FlgL